MYRRLDRRVLAGVASGLGEHLGVDVRLVRLTFIGLTLAGGVGVVLYLAFWFFAPAGPPGAPAQVAGQPSPYSALERAALLLGAAGALLLLSAVGLNMGAGVVWPLFLGVLGLALVWQQADDARRAQWLRSARGGLWAGLTVGGRARALGGAALVMLGGVLFLASRASISDAGPVLTGGLVVLVGVGLISAPWWLQTVRQLSEERAARIREQERAEVAAHVHDSVLHTLTLIQRHVDDPREVARLARAQERELRTWLYRPRAERTVTLSGAVEQISGDVEDALGVQVEVVVVGDCAVDEKIGVLLRAAREALMNAGKHAGPSAGGGAISLYAEVEPGQVTVFVRDRGPGFDLDAVPEDRLGVRQSILGRMERNGGQAVVRSTPGEGTEIELAMPRQPVVVGDPKSAEEEQ